MHFRPTSVSAAGEPRLRDHGTHPKPPRPTGRGVLIAFDRDDAGERGATKLAETLMARGVDCYRVQFPRGMDANEYALKVQPAAKSLALLVRKAQWLGKGEAPALTVGQASTPAALTAAKEETPPSLAAEPAPSAPTVPPAPTPVEVPGESSAEVDGDVLRLVCGARTWSTALDLSVNSLARAATIPRFPCSRRTL